MNEDSEESDKPGKIGHGMTSVTKLPFGVQINESTIAWDFPGTQDSSID